MLVYGHKLDSCLLVVHKECCQMQVVFGGGGNHNTMTKLINLYSFGTCCVDFIVVDVLVSHSRLVKVTRYMVSTTNINIVDLCQAHMKWWRLTQLCFVLLVHGRRC
jgi:hypothetical protein